MDVTVDRAELLKELQLCAAVVAKRVIIPILANIKLEVVDDRLRIVVTDLDVTVRTSIAANVRDASGITVKSEYLLDGIRAASGDAVQIESGGEGDTAYVSVQCGTTKFRVGALSVDDFPTEPEEPTGVAFEFDAALFGSALESASYAQSSEETRFQLNGVCLATSHKRTDIVSTDGCRMALISLADAPRPEHTIMIPSKLVRLIPKLVGGDTMVLTAERHRGGNVLVSRGGPASFVARTPDFNFPNYREAISMDDAHVARVDRARLLSVVGGVRPFAPERTNAARFDLSAGRLAASVQNPDGAQEATAYMAVDYSGAGIAVCMAAHYVTQALEAMGSEFVDIAIDGKQVRMRPADQSGSVIDALHVIMTMQM